MIAQPWTGCLVVQLTLFGALGASLPQVAVETVAVLESELGAIAPAHLVSH